MIKLIYFRLFIEQEIIIYIFVNFILIQMLLINKYVMLIYFYKLFFYITKLVLYVVDKNSITLKKNLAELHNKELKRPEMAIKATKENSIKLSYFVMRASGFYFMWKEKDYQNDIYNDYIEIKMEEKYEYRIKHKFTKNDLKVTSYEKKLYINPFSPAGKNSLARRNLNQTILNKKWDLEKIEKRFFVTKEGKVFSYIFSRTEWCFKNFFLSEEIKGIKLLKRMLNHPCILRIDESTGKTQLVIAFFILNMMAQLIDI